MGILSVQSTQEHFLAWHKIEQTFQSHYTPFSIVFFLKHYGSADIENLDEIKLQNSN